MRDKKARKSTIYPQGSTIVVLVLIVTTGLAGCYRSSSRFSDKQILEMMQQPENLPYNYWHGESRWELTEKDSSMLSYGHLDFGRIFAEKTDWGVIHGEIYMKKSQRLNRNPLLLVPLLDSKDPDVILYALHCYEKRSEVLEQHPFDDLKSLYSRWITLTKEYPDVRVRWKALHLMKEMHWVSTDDLARALDDPAESVRLAAAGYLGQFNSIVEFENNLHPHRYSESDIHTSIAKLAIEHINDNHYHIRFDCAEVLKSLFRISELPFGYIEKKPPDDVLAIDWMRESWWKRNASQKLLLDWWQQNSLIPSPL